MAWKGPRNSAMANPRHGQVHLPLPQGAPARPWTPPGAEIPWKCLAILGTTDFYFGRQEKEQQCSARSSVMHLPLLSPHRYLSLTPQVFISGCCSFPLTFQIHKASWTKELLHTQLLHLWIMTDMKEILAIVSPSTTAYHVPSKFCFKDCAEALQGQKPVWKSKAEPIWPH